jgi:predicted RNA-binding protein with RPS1 domain
MRAYEVSLNGKRLCVAGIGKDGYISAYVTYRSEPNDTWIDVIGLIASKKIYVRWLRKNLRIGDEVQIKIVDRRSVDRFRKTIGRVDKPDKAIELRKRMVRGMAKEFGWEIREKHKAR